MNRLYIISAFAIFAISIAFAVGNTSAQEQNAQQVGASAQPPEPVTFEYAQLVLTEDKFQWLDGDNRLTPNPITLEQISGKLGQNSGRKTFQNLLNIIGGNGWELINFNESTYTFKRAM